jgi:hypothetical protein
MQERMEFLAKEEQRLTALTAHLVEHPTMNNLTVVAATADQFHAAAVEGVQWMDAHPCPIARVGRPMRDAYAQFELFGEILIRMRSGQLPMTAESGQMAAATLLRGRELQTEAAMAFAEESGSSRHGSRCAACSV